MPVVSVIIPTYNRLDSLQKTVDSVLSQTFSDFELIIIDDGSTDDTFSRFNNAKLPVRYYYQPHLGVSAARNRGIRLSKGNYIAFLDSDDLWMQEKLKLQYEFMLKSSDIYICQTNEIWIRNGVRINPRQRHIKPSGNIFYKCLELCIISPSAVMMKREFFDIVGLFDETLPVCEDYDLWLRSSYRFEVPLIKENLTVKHGGHSDQLSGSYAGMDRFRIFALQKLLKHPISFEQRKNVLREIKKKSSVLLAGAIKRKRYFFSLRILLARYFPALFKKIIL